MLRVALLLCLALSCRGGKGPGGALRRRLHAGRAERHPRALAGREARRHARPAGGDREPPRAEVVLYSRLAYDPLKDFSPVALVAIQPNILVVHPSGPASSVRELIAYARQQPGKLNYASSGAGAAAHLAGELFKSMTGVDMVDVCKGRITTRKALRVIPAKAGIPLEIDRWRFLFFQTGSPPSRGRLLAKD